METKEVIVNNDHFEKPPHDVMKFYIKFYCKQKGHNKYKHNKIIEAKKSWLSLNKIEQVQFYNKYKEYQIKWKEKVVECIDKAEPFMKEIETSALDKNVINTKETFDTQQDGEAKNIELIEEAESKENDSTLENLANNTSQQQYLEITESTEENDKQKTLSYIVEDQNNDVELGSEPQELGKLPLLEPRPPMLKSGKELYELVTKNSNSKDTWKTLSSLQRSRYNCAILKLKKDFITNYKLFLENLSSKELFNYYHKTI